MEFQPIKLLQTDVDGMFLARLIDWREEEQKKKVINSSLSFRNLQLNSLRFRQLFNESALPS